jgi:hypothetical protein
MSLQVLSSYRRDDFANPDGFLAQLGLVLEQYDDAVIRWVTSPLTGIQRQCKFPPSIAEVVEACDYQRDHLEGLKRLGPPIQPRRHERLVKQNRANVYVSPESPQYAAMVARSQLPETDPLDWRLDETRPGIWVGFHWIGSMTPAGEGRAKGPRPYTAADFRLDEEKLKAQQAKAEQSAPKADDTEAA